MRNFKPTIIALTLCAALLCALRAQAAETNAATYESTLTAASDFTVSRERLDPYMIYSVTITGNGVVYLPGTLQGVAPLKARTVCTGDPGGGTMSVHATSRKDDSGWETVDSGSPATAITCTAACTFQLFAEGVAGPKSSPHPIAATAANIQINRFMGSIPLSIKI